MKYNFRLFPSAIFFAVLVFCGCATVNVASKEGSEEALSFRCPAGMSLLYVIRMPEVYGGANKLDISLNGNYIGTLSQNSYLYGAIYPGQYKIAKYVAGRDFKIEKDIVVEAGQIYYLDFSINSQFRQTQTSQAGKLLSTCKLSAVNLLIPTLKYIISNYPSSNVVDFLSNGGNADSFDDQGISSLMYAIAMNDYNLMDILISNKADLNLFSPKGTSPIMYSILTNNILAADRLIGKGANVNLVNPDSISAYALACQTNRSDFAIYLFMNGATTDIPDKYPEARAKSSHILADYYLAIGNIEKADSLYLSAEGEYDIAISNCSKDLKSTKLSLLGISFLEILSQSALNASTQLAESHLQQMQAKELNKLSAINYANSSNTGLAGYYAYLDNQKANYSPSFKIFTANQATFKPESGGLVAREEYLSESLKLLEALKSKVTSINSCFKNQTERELIIDCIKSKQDQR